MKLSRKDLELLKKCSGVHGTLGALFDCVSCGVMLEPQKIDVEYIDTPKQYIIFKNN